MKEIYYTDLLEVPYVDKGRDVINGLDCYGLVLECCRRAGNPLNDVLYPNIKQTQKDFERYIVHLNVEQIQAPETNCVMQALPCFL